MVLITALIYPACLDEISLTDSDNPLENIMIRGRLIHGSPSIARINISTLSDFKEFDSPEPIGGAEVFLKDENGNSKLVPMTANGQYETEISAEDPEINILFEKNYQISVDIPGLGKYESSFEPLLPVPPIEAVHKNVVIRTTLDELENIDSSLFIEFLVDTKVVSPEIPEASFLRWKFSGTYKFLESSNVQQPLRPIYLCYFTDHLNLDKISLFNGRETDLSQLTNHLILEEPIDHRFNSGFYLNVVQQSLSEGAFRYWDQINSVIDRNGSFFETLPARVKGNIVDTQNPDVFVFGYFNAMAEDSLRIFVSPNDAKFPSSFCRPVQTTNEFSNLPDECRVCLSKSGSTHDRPSFWID